MLGFGTNAVDHLIRVPIYPTYDTKLEISAYTVEPGGEVASTLVGLQRLGCKTAYAGRFGSDPAGELGKKSLVDEGVDVSLAETVNGSTQVGFIIIDETTGERTVLWRRDESLAYTRADAPVNAVARASMLHMTAHDVEACLAMARAAREHDVVVSLDVDNVFPGIDKLLRLTDVLTATSEFIANLTGSTDTRQTLADVVTRYGCKLGGVTLGRAGSLFYCNGEFVETPGFDVPVGCVDTTGAGDAFRSGLLCGILAGDRVEEIARKANAVAALKCRDIGARRGLPDAQQLTKFLSSLN